MSRKQQNLCLGVCSHNQTVKYICCGRQDVPAERRISEERESLYSQVYAIYIYTYIYNFIPLHFATECLRNHRNNGGNILITNGMVARRNEFPFMVCMCVRNFWLQLLRNLLRKTIFSKKKNVLKSHNLYKKKCS